MSTTPPAPGNTLSQRKQKFRPLELADSQNGATRISFPPPNYEVVVISSVCFLIYRTISTLSLPSSPSIPHWPRFLARLRASLSNFAPLVLSRADGRDDDDTEVILHCLAGV